MVHKCDHHMGKKKVKKVKPAKGGAGNPLDPNDKTIGNKFWSE